MSYVGAPYNFVPLGKKVYRKDEITKHSEISGLSGYLEYQVRQGGGHESTEGMGVSLLSRMILQMQS